MPAPQDPQDPEDPAARSVRPSREDVVDTTIELLRTVGPQGVQARRIAAELGVSTIVVYRRFGGMPQLVAAVVDAGFHRLSAAFAGQTDRPDPIAGICALATTYRATAHANPHLFDLMFGLSNPGGYRPDPWATSRAADPATVRPPAFDLAYRPLVGYAARAIEEGFLRPGDPESVAAQLWSFSHGFVVLELAGHFASFADPYADVFVPLAINLVVGLGDGVEHARSAMGAAGIPG